MRRGMRHSHTLGSKEPIFYKIVPTLIQEMSDSYPELKRAEPLIIEIWNLVFMQFEQVSKDKRINLPKPSVDTGMGLERISALLQGTHDNYATDHFKTLIEASSNLTKTKVTKENISSHRVIADHLRASSFFIAEGLLPSNEGRG